MPDAAQPNNSNILGRAASQLPSWMNPFNVWGATADALDSAGNTIWANPDVQTAAGYGGAQGGDAQASTTLGNGPANVNRPLTQAERDEISNLAAASGMSLEEITHWMGEPGSVPSVPYEQMKSIVDANKLNAEAASRVDSARDTSLGEYDQQIGRREGILHDSTGQKLRTDAQFGGMLGQAERRLNAGYQQALRQTREAQAASGGGAVSGRSQTLASQALMGRNQGLADASSQILGRIGSERDTLGTERTQANDYYTNKSNDVRAGRQTDVNPFWENALGIRELAEGKTKENYGTNFDRNLGLLSLGSNFVTGAKNDLTSAVSHLRGGQGPYG